MASGLSKRASAIESAVALLSWSSDRLRYLRPTMLSLIESAYGTDSFKGAAYLAPCLARMERGESFPESWRAALDDAPGALGREEREIMRGLASVLGATDLESQLAALAFAVSQLENRLALARADREKHQKLYGTLGVLGGIAVAIILI